MLTKEWKQFQSGTDIRGIASEGVKGEEINLTDEVIVKITSSFVLWLSKKTEKNPRRLQISVGHDSRISAGRISLAVMTALTSHGVQVYDCGLASTPAMFMSTLDLPCDGAIQITASHHPFNRNGLKFFTPKGGLDSPDITTILEQAERNKPLDLGEGGMIIPSNYMDTYCEHLREMVQKEVKADDYEKPLTGFRIIVDAGNGAGGFYASEVLKPLGASIEGSQFLEPDGLFPNHVPNPENAEAMQSISEAVLKYKADLGVIFDTDVDRCAAVDPQGQEINRNRLVALAASIALEGNTGGTIVTDSITSSGLKSYIEKTLGGTHHRFKRGYKNVINEAVRLNQEGINCPLAIETSGHAALRENHFLDDGAYLVTKLIIKMALLKREEKTLESLLDDLAEPVESLEIRLPILEEDFRTQGEKLIQDLENHAKEQNWEIAPDNHEGLRVSFGEGQGSGWFLLRLSVHDPIMPLNIESDVESGVKEILSKLSNFLMEYKGIDITVLTNI